MARAKNDVPIKGVKLFENEHDQEVFLERVANDLDDFSPGKIKVSAEDPVFSVPFKDGSKRLESFEGVVVFAKRVATPPFGNPDGEPVEKRVMYILRNGRVTPDVLWLSTTSIANWLKYCQALQTPTETHGQVRFCAVWTKFTLDKATSKKYNKTWYKPNYEFVRMLTDDELSYILELVDAVKIRDEKFSSTEGMVAAEEAAAGGAPVPAKPADDEDEDEPKTKKPRAKKSNDDDDEDATPPAPKSKAKKPADDDEEDDDAPPAKKSKNLDEDDEEEEEATKPTPKKSKNLDDEDDEEEEATKPTPKKSKGLPGLDPDDEE